MKTTNYEISKKLAEIGFKAESNFFVNFYEYKIYCKNPKLPVQISDYSEPKKDKPSEFLGYIYKSYDLETILEVLPAVLEMVINDNNKRGFLLDWKYGCYEEIFIEKQDTESLADTAGRLLIKLHENNLIKFSDEKTN